MMHKHCKRIILNISCRVFQVKFENKLLGNSEMAQHVKAVATEE